MKLNFAHLHNVIHYSFHQHRRHRQYCRYRHHRYFYLLFCITLTRIERLGDIDVFTLHTSTCTNIAQLVFA